MSDLDQSGGNLDRFRANSTWSEFDKFRTNPADSGASNFGRNKAFQGRLRPISGDVGQLWDDFDRTRAKLTNPRAMSTNVGRSPSSRERGRTNSANLGQVCPTSMLAPRWDHSFNGRPLRPLVPANSLTGEHVSRRRTHGQASESSPGEHFAFAFARGDNA